MPSYFRVIFDSPLLYLCGDGVPEIESCEGKGAFHAEDDGLSGDLAEGEELVEEGN